MSIFAKTWLVLVIFGLAAVTSAVGPSAVAAGSLSPIPCANTEVIPTDPKFDALPGAKVYFGAYQGGFYRFEVPDTWNGELALYMHGTNFSNTLAFNGPSNGLRAYWVQQGFAWGASTYSCNGYIPGIGLTDTIQLRELFSKVTGKAAPTRSYVAGQSMGGFQTELALHAYPTMFDGGLAMCGMNSANWDLYVALGAAAEYITGVRFTDPATTAAAQTQ